ncbi:hypothetical protein RM764_38405 [Streptomyces sp. DSM 41699]|uniref:Uncharacterized protein n=1 Tax=Streptomyces gibsoniae TaxID=3075529 RepID=A0ABU2U6C7_9ACTN|nr:hypothetical protein [Streptomyces sp. DSM 41699]MDT0468786.1 hypothetical protein [Streptomyces sp. DSM 41699]
MLTVLLLPVAAVAMDTGVYHASMRTAQAQIATRRPATARPVVGVPAALDPIQRPVSTQVRVTGADRPAYLTTAQVTPGTAAGTALHVWVDRRSGQIVSGPVSAAQAARKATWAAVMAGLLLPGLAYAMWRCLRSALDRVRLDRWQDEWQRVEPVWSRRYHHRQ